MIANDTLQQKSQYLMADAIWVQRYKKWTRNILYISSSILKKKTKNINICKKGETHPLTFKAFGVHLLYSSAQRYESLLLSVSEMNNGAVYKWIIYLHNESQHIRGYVYLLFKEECCRQHYVHLTSVWRYLLSCMIFQLGNKHLCVQSVSPRASL